MTIPRLQQRSRMLQAVRSFFLSRNYLEVDTPLRLPTLIPEAQILPFRSEESFLHTSPELCMKRLLAEGAQRIFQLCHCFRKAETGRVHSPEFMMLEWYQVGWSYRELMDECEDFVCFVTGRCLEFPGVAENGSLLRADRMIPLQKPFKRMTVTEAFATYASMPVEQALERDLYDELLVTEVEPHLGWDRPVFLYDYPARLASLAKHRQEAPDLAERFELYIGGLELANGFSELTDSSEQRRRFEAEAALIRELRNETPALPEKFLTALETMPEAAGIAFGFDRFLMLLLGAKSLADVLSFSSQEL